MDPTNLEAWPYDAADLQREEEKRWYSPASFFFSQGQALVLAASYFRNDRLTPQARGGVARKHRHRVHLALFGQLLASLEYLFKDFIAQVVDVVDIYDEQIKKADWITVDAGHILSVRTARGTPGAMLLHPTMGWQNPKNVNARYSRLFEFSPIHASEIETLEQLWVLRHSVAHNAGFVTSHDAARAGMPHLSNEVAAIDDEFIREAFYFLCEIASRVAESVGDTVLIAWLKSRVDAGKDYKRDKQTYSLLKWLATYVDSRAQAIPRVLKGQYSDDWARANP